MTKIFTKDNNEFYDDYAHHPTEIQSVLSGIRKVYKDRKIISVFQPHRYSRLKTLKSEFSKSFINSEIVLLCPVYAAGEKKDKSFSQISFSKIISKNSKTQVINIEEKNDLKKYFQRNLLNNEIIIGMGAGSISQWMRELKNILWD